MNIRAFVAATAIAAVAMSAFALSAEHTDWGRGPAQYLMTRDEAAKWATVTTDEQADAFIALFWARRDPTPATPRNEFRQDFEARVKAADDKLGTKKLRGAMTDQGKALILFGVPAKREHIAVQAQSGTADQPATAVDQPDAMQWTYDGDATKDLFGSPHVVLRFVDRLGSKDYKFERGGTEIAAAQQRVAEKSVTQPELTAPPVYGQPKAAAAPVAAAPEAPQTELKDEALRTAVAEMKSAAKNPYAGKAFASWGEFVTDEGETFVPVLLYLPKSSGVSASQNLVFFGAVESADGKPLAAFEQPAKLVASKDDWFVDTTVKLPAGKARGWFGIAEAGKPVAIAAADLDVAGTLDKDAAGISPLILSNNLFPLPVAQTKTDPYAFGGVKVVPKADRVFHKSDDLWYFFELRNPGLATSGADAATVPVAEPAGGMPRIQVKLELEGTDAAGKKSKMTAPPTEVGAVPVKGVRGHYGVGSAIPLASFKPGDYTFTVKVIDTVLKSSYTLRDTFKLVE